MCIAPSNETVKLMTALHITVVSHMKAGTG